MTAGLFALAMAVLTATVLGFFARALRQPLIVAYLATGAIIGYFNVFNVADQETFHIFSELGVMFLLFLVGLEINYDSLRLVGRASLLLGIGQIIVTFVIGLGLAQLFGFPLIHSAYIAIALTFSSTIIAVKMLSERRDINSLHGRLAIGILLVQDFAVILLLVVLAGFSTGTTVAPFDLLIAAGKGTGLFAIMLFLGRKILPRLAARVARSTELLFITSLAWVFATAAVVARLGLSIEIAGFLAGLALANASEHYQIAGRIRPLRDFFIVIFFVMLGATTVTASFAGLTWPIVAFSLFVLIGNPLIVLAIMGFMGYRRRTAFLTGVTIAQISEFSLVLAALGRSVGHLDDMSVSLITAVAIVTITLSSYVVTHADAIFRRLARPLALFERRTTKENGWTTKEFAKPFILIGAHRTGQSIAFSLPKNNLLIIDFDPEVVAEMARHGYEYIFGDIGDPEVALQANFGAAKAVISTSPDFEDNLAVIQMVAGLNPRPKAIVRADTEEDARLLYVRGADYVLLPNITAGQYFGKTLALDPTLGVLEHLRHRDIAMLAKRRRFAVSS